MIEKTETSEQPTFCQLGIYLLRKVWWLVRLALGQVRENWRKLLPRASVEAIIQGRQNHYPGYKKLLSGVHETIIQGRRPEDERNVSFFWHLSIFRIQLQGHAQHVDLPPGG